MRRLKVPTTTVDMQTGKATESVAEFGILPPSNPNACQACGRVHGPEEPHDALRLQYQYSFRAEHGRWPTWADAMAHCDEAMKARWIAGLTGMGLNLDMSFSPPEEKRNTGGN
jgi:hypothetical protein